MTDRELMIETMRRQGVLTESLIQWLVGLHDRVTALESRVMSERVERRYKEQR